MFFCCAGEIAQADKTQLSAKACIKSDAQPERKSERNVRGNIGLLRSEEEKQRRPSQKQDANGNFSAPGRSASSEMSRGRPPRLACLFRRLWSSIWTETELRLLSPTPRAAVLPGRRKTWRSFPA